jgi:5-methylthioadenosine/S-adenosylhomocysteine deaminase
MSATLIRDAEVVTMDDDLGTLTEADVLIRNSLIEAVGPGLDAPDAEVIDGKGKVVMPGLIDGHRHMFSGLLRGGCSDVTYTGNTGGYFEVVIKQFGGSFTPEDTYRSSRIGALESANSGITTLHAWDHNLMSPEHARASLKAMRDSGLRGRFSYGPPNDTMVLDLDDVAALREEQFGNKSDGRWETDDGLWHLGIATRGVELSNPEIWEKEGAFAREHGLPWTAHLMAEGDVTTLKEHGFLGPDLLACHALNASEAELAELAATDTPVCVSSPALARAGDHLSPVVDLMRAGVRVCLAVDSTAGCDTADMFAVMRITMLVERLRHKDAGVYSTEDALRQATIDGSLTPGKRADVLVINRTSLNLAPWTVTNTLLSSCVYPSDVEAVFIDGRCVKRDGALVGVDVAAEVKAANEAFANLESRVEVPFE